MYLTARIVGNSRNACYPCTLHKLKNSIFPSVLLKLDTASVRREIQRCAAEGWDINKLAFLCVVGLCAGLKSQQFLVFFMFVCRNQLAHLCIAVKDSKTKNGELFELKGVQCTV